MSGWMLMGGTGISVYNGDFRCMDCRRAHLRNLGELEFRIETTAQSHRSGQRQFNLAGLSEEPISRSISFGSGYFRTIHPDFLLDLYIIRLCCGRQIIQYNLRPGLHHVSIYYRRHRRILYIPRRISRRILDGLHSRGTDVLRHSRRADYSGYVPRRSDRNIPAHSTRISSRIKPVRRYNGFVRLGNRSDFRSRLGARILRAASHLSSLHGHLRRA